MPAAVAVVMCRCEINFDNAEGELIGTPNKGMSHMFTFINTSRMGTAVQVTAADPPPPCEAARYTCHYVFTA